jgi:ABC-2 type transport system permease protein
MSTTTLNRPVAPAGTPHLSFARVVASEWRKLFSLRSTWWTLGSALVLQVGMAALIGVALRAASSVDTSGGSGFTVDASQAAAQGLLFAQLAVVVLAVLTITAEYSSGQIRVTLAAVPRRLPVLWAKALVLVVVVLVLGVVSSALSVGVAMLVGGDLIRFSLPGAETARILAGAPLYLIGIALLSLGVGGMLRHTAGAVAGLMGFLVVVELVIGNIPWKPLQLISPWLPGTAGQQVMATDESVQSLRDLPNHVGAVLDPWAGYGVLVAWAVLALAVAAVMLRSRDA